MKVRVKTSHLPVGYVHFHFFGRDFAILNTWGRNHPVDLEKESPFPKYKAWRGSVFEKGSDMKSQISNVKERTCGGGGSVNVKCQMSKVSNVKCERKNLWRGRICKGGGGGVHLPFCQCQCPPNLTLKIIGFIFLNI